MTPSEERIYGLVGSSLISHSLSPFMHNAAFAALRINARYLLFELKPEELKGFFASLREKNIYGLNVTVPYKEKALLYLKNISHEARLIGAVNTIKVSGGILEGYNTDGEGFIRHLKDDLGFDPRSKHIAILGAGGASRAISVYLCKEAPASISIYDVDSDKAYKLVNYLRENCDDGVISYAVSIAELHLREADLVVNATAVGMEEADPCIIDVNSLNRGVLVYDLIYNPKETKLLKAAKAAGLRVSNGLGMLLYQGMLAFEIWTGKSAPKEVMQKALEGNI